MAYSTFIPRLSGTRFKVASKESITAIKATDYRVLLAIHLVGSTFDSLKYDPRSRAVRNSRPSSSMKRLRPVDPAESPVKSTMEMQP